MKLGFRKRIKVAPGITLNVGKQSASVRLGPKGAGITSGTEGSRASGSIPHTGITATHKIAGKSKAPKPETAKAGPISVAVAAAVLIGISYAIFTALSR